MTRLWIAALALATFVTLVNADGLRINLKKAPLSPTSVTKPSRLHGLLSASNGEGNVPITNFLDAQVCIFELMLFLAHARASLALAA